MIVPMRITLNLDVNDLDRMEAFWTAALHYRRAGELGPYRGLAPESGDGPRLILQLVPEPKTTKTRLHLDLDHDAGFDIESEASRLEQLGARRLTGVIGEDGGGEWIVMADPEGNEFCVCRDG